MKAELRSCRSTLAARYEVSNINGSPRSQNVRYQCANVGFLALKLPSHSGIIQARIVCRRRIPSAVSFSLPFHVGFLIVDIPLRAASIPVPLHPCPASPRLSSVISLRPSHSRTWEPPSSSSDCRDVINYDGDDVLSSRTSAGK